MSEMASGSERPAAFNAALIQTILGYGSAGFGLINELIVAARFGANSTTDLFRWSSLLPFYALTFGAVIGPLYFRSRLLRNGQNISLLRFKDADHVAYASWVQITTLGIGLFAIASLAVATRFPTLQILLLSSSTLALGQFVCCAAMVPAFLYGMTWIFVVPNIVYNIILSIVLLAASDLIHGLIWATGVGALVMCLIISIAPRFTEAFKVDSPIISSARGERPEQLTVLFPIFISNIASMISVLLFFNGLNAANPGLISIYSIAQKAGLIIAVPGAALVNRLFRDDSLLGRGITARQILLGVIPVALASPLVAAAAYNLILGVYGFAEGSAPAISIAWGCCFGVCFSALPIAMNVVVLGRSTGRDSVGPLIMGLAINLVGAASIIHFRAEPWVVAIPALCGATGAALGVAWISRRSGVSQMYPWGLFTFCFAMAIMVALILTSRFRIVGEAELQSIGHAAKQVLGH